MGGMAYTLADTRRKIYVLYLYLNKCICICILKYFQVHIIICICIFQDLVFDLVYLTPWLTASRPTSMQLEQLHEMVLISLKKPSCVESARELILVDYPMRSDEGSDAKSFDTLPMDSLPSHPLDVWLS